MGSHTGTQGRGTGWRRERSVLTPQIFTAKHIPYCGSLEPLISSVFARKIQKYRRFIYPHQDQIKMFNLLLASVLLNFVKCQQTDQEQSREAEMEGFFSSLDFQSILIGVAGFWGGVFCMGLLYLLAVLTKRVFKPEEAEKIAEKN